MRPLNRLPNGAEDYESPSLLFPASVTLAAMTNPLKRGLRGR